MRGVHWIWINPHFVVLLLTAVVLESVIFFVLTFLFLHVLLSDDEFMAIRLCHGYLVFLARIGFFFKEWVIECFPDSQSLLRIND